MIPTLLALALTFSLSRQVQAAESLRGPATASAYGERANQFGLGLASVENLTLSTTAITGVLSLSAADSIHGFLAIPGTHPFQIMVAGLFKHTVVEQSGYGLHVGGGFGMGSVKSPRGSGSGFGLSIDGIFGFHFPIPGAPKIQASFDGGPALIVRDGETDFEIGALSSLLGLSVVFMF